MLRLPHCAIIIIATALAACSNPTPTPSPTATPTAIAVANSGVIAPTNRDDPQTFLATLPAAEQACLAANSDPMRLLTLAGLPGAEIASPQAAADAIDCLGDDTLLRVFLSAMLVDVGPLSRDSSDCIRAGFADFDLRPLLLAGDVSSGPGDNLLERAAMFGSLRPFLLALSCLNRPEWVAGLQYFSMPKDNWAILKCVRNVIGGTDALADALQPRGGPIPRAFRHAEIECLSLPLPEPATGKISLISRENPQAFLSALPAAEQDCLSAYPDPGRVMNLAKIASPYEAVEMLSCLGHNTLMRIFLGWTIADIGPLSRESSACVRAGFARFSAIDLRLDLLERRDDEMSHRGSSALMWAGFLLPLCLNDAERQAAFPHGHRFSDDALEHWQCLMNKLGGPIKLTVESPSYYAAMTECPERE